MGKHIDTFDQMLIKENKSGFILQSEPLEKSMKLREKLAKIITGLEDFENSVIKQFHSESEDYTKETNDLTQEISSISNDPRIDSLIISLEDFNTKNI
jgi:hypothetical protein